MAGCRKLHLIEKSFLAALGADLRVFEPTGTMIVDVGGGTTDISILSLGGVVVTHSIRVGGIKMDEAIINFIKQEFNMLIGDRTAEEVKLDLASALPFTSERMARIRGRDMITNLPQFIDISTTQIFESIQDTCYAIVEAIKYVLSLTPPELTRDIIENNIYLTGGGAMLFGLDQLISTELNIPVILSKQPMEDTINGLGNLIENYDTLKNMIQSNINKSV